jgi:hypothetical protein
MGSNSTVIGPPSLASVGPPSLGPPPVALPLVELALVELALVELALVELALVGPLFAPPAPLPPWPAGLVLVLEQPYATALALSRPRSSARLRVLVIAFSGFRQALGMQPEKEH